ncbi:MAG: glycosyltransferase family 39 protein [Candidatus Omnitrophica bacterium]|nr:glycosyltransferase family 39 protein [Candidatus Omnitrophota bacterium]
MDKYCSKKFNFLFAAFIALLFCCVFYFFGGHSIVKIFFTNPLEHYYQKIDIAFSFFIFLFGVWLVAYWSIILNKIELFISGLSICAVILVLIATSKYGPGVNSDSMFYLTAGENLVKGKGLIVFNGSYFVDWPPLFSVLLGFFYLLGVNTLIAAQWINAIAFGLIVFFTGILLQKKVKTSLYIIAGVMAIFLSSPLLTASVFVHSDILFALFILLFAIALTRYLERPNPHNLFFTTVFVIFACMQRYAGIFVIGAGFISILFLTKGKGVRENINHALVFTIATSVLFGMWLFRNYAVSATLTGVRAPEHIFEFSRAVKSLLNVMSLWILPGSVPLFLRSIILCGVILFLVCINIYFYSKNKERANSEGNGILSIVIVVIFYLGFMTIYSAKETAYNVTDRLLAPIYPLLILLMFVSIVNFLTAVKNYKRAALIINCLVIIFLIYSSVRVVERFSTFLLNGAGGFNVIVYRESELFKWLRNNKLEGELYSNVPEAVYSLSGKTTFKTPKKDKCPTEFYRNDDLERLAQDIKKKESVFFIWFNKKQDCLYEAAEVKDKLLLKEFKIFADGAIYAK